MGNICFKCAKAYAHKCEKIACGKVPEGWTKSYCPFFEQDCIDTLDGICEALGITQSQFYCAFNFKGIKAFAKRKGYRFYVEHCENGTNKYFLKKINPR